MGLWIGTIYASVFQYPPSAPKKIFVSSSRQILIKAHIVNIDHNSARELGLIFNASSNKVDSPGGFSMNLPSAASASDFIFPIAALSQSIILDATLNALEETGQAQLISDPQLITLDKKAAIIEAGQEVPYQQTSENGGTSVTFKKAVLRLQVVPEIKSANLILLNLIINQDQVSELTVNGVPAINTQQLKTQVLIKNKHTLVLGGIIQKGWSDQQQAVPFLSKIPWLGALFRYKRHTDDNKQLLILVTPILL